MKPFEVQVQIRNPSSFIIRGQGTKNVFKSLKKKNRKLYNNQRLFQKLHGIPDKEVRKKQLTAKLILDDIYDIKLEKK